MAIASCTNYHAIWEDAERRIADALGIAQRSLVSDASIGWVYTKKGKFVGRLGKAKYEIESPVGPSQ
jgi:hypothetical protein